MKRSPLIFGILLGLIAASGLFAYLGRQQLSEKGATGSGQQRELNIAHSLPIDHPVHQGIEHFSQRLSELSGGSITCKIFPSGQLGKETTYLEKLQSGSLDIAKTSAAPIASFVPRMKVFSFPYLFRDRDHYWKVLDGEVGTDLLNRLSDRGEGKTSGLQGLCYFDAGSRNFYTKSPVSQPADLKGMTIRVMQDPVAMAMMRSFQANPKAMGGGEIYGALQRGNIVGAENNPPTFVADRHFEVCKHFTFDHHSRIPDVLAISDQLWQQLSDQEKVWFRTAAREASQFQRKLWQEKSDAAVAIMKQEGVSLHQPDISTFREAVQDAGKELLTPEIRKIQDAIQATR